MAVVTNFKGDFLYLSAENIVVPHCFTTRQGGVSSGIFDSLNIGRHRGDSDENIDRNFERLAEAMDIETDGLVLARQTHSDIVRRVIKADHRTLDHRDYPECDALITNDPGCGLVIFTADCTPILLWDPITGAVGAAHAGWRGTAARTMRAAFGSEADLFIRFDGEKYYSDLKRLNSLDLRRAGVRQIEISEACTMCEHQRFWSHRYTKGERGSQGAVIVCQGVLR